MVAADPGVVREPYSGDLLAILGYKSTKLALQVKIPFWWPEMSLGLWCYHTIS